MLAVEILYYLAPNIKQRFAATLPGAVLSVAVWIGLSFLLGIYFRHFANFNRTYGALGGLIALMTWLYWITFVLLVGAEINAELAKETEEGSLRPKATPGNKSVRNRMISITLRNGVVRSLSVRSGYGIVPSTDTPPS